jgi:hypothetical protein
LVAEALTKPNDCIDASAIIADGCSSTLGSIEAGCRAVPLPTPESLPAFGEVNPIDEPRTVRHGSKCLEFQLEPLLERTSVVPAAERCIDACHGLDLSIARRSRQFDRPIGQFFRSTRPTKTVFEIGPHEGETREVLRRHRFVDVVDFAGQPDEVNPHPRIGVHEVSMQSAEHADGVATTPVVDGIADRSAHVRFVVNHPSQNVALCSRIRA